MGVIAQVGGPRQLYERPGSRFVADFLGETNFLQAVVTEGFPESGSGQATLSLHTPAGDLRSTAFDPANLPKKGNVTCSVRPEAWRLIEPKGSPGGNGSQAGSTGSAGGVLVGTVAETMYLGDVAQYQVDLPGDVRVKVLEVHPSHGADGYKKPGETVRLAVEPRDVVVLAD